MNRVIFDRRRRQNCTDYGAFLPRRKTDYSLINARDEHGVNWRRRVASPRPDYTAVSAFSRLRLTAIYKSIRTERLGRYNRGQC